MLQQAQNARDALIASGLSRKDFRVSTERIVKNRQFVGYGDAQITILHWRKGVECTPAMLLQGLSVHHRICQSCVAVAVKNDGKGKFTQEDYRNVR